MDCEKASLLIEDFYDCEADLQSKDCLEEHLAACSLLK